MKKIVLVASIAGIMNVTPQPIDANSPTTLRFNRHQRRAKAVQPKEHPND